MSEWHQDKELLREIVNISPVCLVVVNRSGKFTFANDYAVEVLGLEKDDISDRMYNDPKWKITTLEGDPFPDEKLPFQQILRTKKPVQNIQHAIEWADGQRVFLSIDGKPLFDMDGKLEQVVFAFRDVTKQILAEQALRSQEQETRYMLDHMLNAFVLFESVFDEQGTFISYRFVYINHAYERITGVKNDEVRGKTVHEVWPGTEPEWVKRYGEVAVSGKTQEFELYHDPTKKLYYCHVYRPFDTKAKFCVIFEDITEQRAAQENLRLSAEHLKLAIKGGKLGTWDWDLLTDHVQFNDLWSVMKGYSPDEIKPHISSWENLVHPDDLPIAKEKVAAHFSGETPIYNMEFRMRHKSGDWMWVLDRGQVIEWDAAGKPTRACGTHLDITALKQGEERLHHINAILRTIRNVNQLIVREKDKRRLIQSVCDTLIEHRGYEHAWAVLFDENGDFDMAAAAGLGDSFSPLLNQMKQGQLPPCGQKALQESGLVKIDVPLSFCLDCPLAENNRYQSVLSMPLKSNERIYGLLLVSLPENFSDDAEEHSLFREVADDVAFALWSIEIDIMRRKSEEEIKKYSKHLEELVQERTQALETAQVQLIRNERLAALGQLAGGIAHELRHPLGVIHNVAFLLKAQLSPSTDEIAESLAMLDEEVQRADRIITDLLEFARTGKGMRSAINLSTLLEDVLKEYTPPNGVTTSISIPKNLPSAHVDPGHVRQIVANLIRNAYDAMPKGGSLSINVEQVDEKDEERIAGDYLLIKVTDTGVGISPDNLEKIFEPLFTTKEWGIGLGLAISKTLAEANQGQLDVESIMGRGSTFRLLLPVYHARGADD